MTPGSPDPMSTPERAAATAAPPKRSKLRLLLIIAVVLLAGGGGAYWWMRQQAVAAAASTGAEAAPETPAEKPGSLLPLQTFTVNLADPGVSRFLRVTVQLVVSGADSAAALEQDPLALTRIRSEVLELLTTQRSETLVTPDGKTALKKDIASRVSTTVGHEITDVLFSDFVVQF